MLISWLGWSVSGIADCFVIFPEKVPVMEGMSSPFLPLVACLVDRAHCDALLPPLSKESPPRGSLQTTHCPPLTPHRTLLMAHRSLLMAHRSLLMAHRSLLMAHRSLLTADCPPHTAHRR